ncbi:MAG: PaaI family thioesterase [Oscillospiraceae bacterium]|jgi:acyl-CoA thioesterase|nr:PaaI family thioesterase [Oscillospiraceae bacterium]
MTEELRETMLRFGRSANPFDEHNGVRLTDVGDGFAVVETDLCRENLNSWNSPHGGLLFTMADVACGVAAISLRQEQCVTVNASMDFLAAAGSTGRLRAVGRVERCGRKLCFTTAEIRDEQETLLARIQVTMYFTGRKLEL